MADDGRQEVKGFLLDIIRGIVDYPDQVTVDVTPSAHLNVFTVRCPTEADIGKIIGKNGKNVQAIRTLMTAIGAKLGVRSVLEIDTNQKTAA